MTPDLIQPAEHMDVEKERKTIMGVEKAQILLLPVPIAGHMIPMLEMAKHLLHHDGGRRFSVTVLVMQIFGSSSADLSTYIDYVTSCGLDVSFEFLPEVPPPLNAAELRPGTVISMHVDGYRENVKQALIRHKTLASPIAAIFLDFFASPMIDVANELNVPPYVFSTMGATMIGIMLYLPTLDVKFPVDLLEDVDVDGIDLPGFADPVPPLSMPDSTMNKKDPVYDWFVSHGQRFQKAKGILVNTFFDLQPRSLDSLADDGKRYFSKPNPPVFPIGPLFHNRPGGEQNKSDHECVRWLDQQPPSSVIFLCFGSNGTFTPAQLAEIAIGLEASGHRFLWSVRRRSTSKFGNLKDADLNEVLDSGFLERTKKRGLVWPSWVPQVEILSHPATAAFVTHCGWNSCLESILSGVPMLAWPLYAEQHLNGYEMTKEIGVAVGLAIDRKGGNWVKAEELERGVRCLMDEGSGKAKEVSAKVKEMKDKGVKALQCHGSSTIWLDQLKKELVDGISVLDWKTRFMASTSDL